MSIEIEKNVPIPSDGRASEFTNALNGMEIGDSFKLPPYKNPATIKSNLSTFGKTHGKKFSLKKIDDEYRIWRIK